MNNPNSWAAEDPTATIRIASPGSQAGAVPGGVAAVDQSFSARVHIYLPTAPSGLLERLRSRARSRGGHVMTGPRSSCHHRARAGLLRTSTTGLRFVLSANSKAPRRAGHFKRLVYVRQSPASFFVCSWSCSLMRLLRGELSRDPSSVCSFMLRICSELKVRVSLKDVHPLERLS